MCAFQMGIVGTRIHWNDCDLWTVISLNALIPFASLTVSLQLMRTVN